MSAKSEYEAAYFTLLRAREELDHLRAYQQFLEEELGRLGTFVKATQNASDVVPRKFRRLVDSTAKPLVEQVGKRRAVVLAERDAVPERIDAQNAFILELEEEVAALRP